MLIYTIKKTLGISQVVNCIQNIGFTTAIWPCNTVYSITKLQVLFVVVLKIKQLQPADVHTAKLVFLSGYCISESFHFK